MNSLSKKILSTSWLLFYAFTVYANEPPLEEPKNEAEAIEFARGYYGKKTIDEWVDKLPKVKRLSLSPYQKNWMEIWNFSQFQRRNFLKMSSSRAKLASAEVGLHFDEKDALAACENSNVPLDSSYSDPLRLNLAMLSESAFRVFNESHNRDDIREKLKDPKARCEGFREIRESLERLPRIDVVARNEEQSTFCHGNVRPYVIVTGTDDRGNFFMCGIGAGGGGYAAMGLPHCNDFCPTSQAKIRSAQQEEIQSAELRTPESQNPAL